MLDGSSNLNCTGTKDPRFGGEEEASNEDMKPVGPRSSSSAGAMVGILMGDDGNATLSACFSGEAICCFGFGRNAKLLRLSPLILPTKLCVRLLFLECIAALS